MKPLKRIKADSATGFKKAGPTDAAMLLGLVKRYYEFDHIEFDARVIRVGLKSLLANKMLGCAWFILQDEVVAGYVVATFGFDYEFGGRVATITDLYLEPEWRGKGLGRQTLAHVEKFCRVSGIHGLELQVERKNARAKRLYQGFGFEALDRIPMSKRIRQSK